MELTIRHVCVRKLQKTPTAGGLESFQAGEHITSWEATHPSSTEAPELRTLADLALCISIWLCVFFLFFVFVSFYKLVNVFP